MTRFGAEEWRRTVRDGHAWTLESGLSSGRETLTPPSEFSEPSIRAPDGTASLILPFETRSNRQVEVPARLMLRFEVQAWSRLFGSFELRYVIADGQVNRRWFEESPDAVISGPLSTIAAFAMGLAKWDRLVSAGGSVDGNFAVLSALALISHENSGDAVGVIVSA